MLVQKIPGVRVSVILFSLAQTEGIYILIVEKEIEFVTGCIEIDTDPIEFISVSSVTTPEHVMVSGRNVRPVTVSESKTVPDESTNSTIKSLVVRADDGFVMGPNVNDIKPTDSNENIPLN